MKYLQVIGFIAVGVMPAFGGSVTSAFSFDNGSLANGSSNSAIQTYMNSQLGSGKSVVVSGSVATNTYTGDGHVIGPGNGSTSYTLGGPNDLFLTNIANTSTEIKMIFTGLSITSVSFDYEIFPDGTCPSGTGCGVNQPDFTFAADGSIIFHTVASPPPTGSHSPNSGPTHTEQAAQFIGTTGTINLGGVSTLEFKDWPATIGIDNLVITYGSGNSSPTPEPVSFTLAGTGLIGIYFLRRRKSGLIKSKPRG